LIKGNSEVFAANAAVGAGALLGHVIEDAIIFRLDDELQVGHSRLERKRTIHPPIGARGLCVQSRRALCAIHKIFIGAQNKKPETDARIQGSAAVAQLDRVLGYEPRGRGFESCQPHQLLKVQ
jgi:hypothetical protein